MKYKNPLTNQVLTHGQSIKTLSGTVVVGINATPELYAQYGYYLIVEDYPAINPDTHKYGVEHETPNHDLRQILVTRSVVELPLETLKQNKINELMQAHVNSLSTGYLCTNGILAFATDDDVRMLRDGIEIAQGMNESTMTIKAFDSSFHVLNISDAHVMFLELAVNCRNKWLNLNVKITEVNSAVSLTEIQSIVW